MEQGVSAFDGLAATHQLVKLGQLGLCQTDRQAQLAQIAA